MSVSLQKRGKRWTANVRLNGHTVSGTFDLKSAADKFAERVRHAIQDAHASGRPFDPLPFKRVVRTRKAMPTATEAQDEIDRDNVPRPDWTLRRALRSYEGTVADALKGARQARSRIKAWQVGPMAGTQLRSLTADHLTAWIEARTKPKKRKAPGKAVVVERLPVAASTIRNDLYLLSALYEHARKPTTKKGWGLGLENPVAAVALPDLPEGRQARLEHDDEGGDLARILAAVGTGPDPVAMRALVTVAVETGMRRSEILDLRAGQVRRTAGGYVVERPSSKSGKRRRVVLSDAAAAALLPLKAGRGVDDLLIPLSDDNVAYRWNRGRRLAGCPAVRLHDLRHEALSSMADAGLSIGALAAQSGHTTTQTLLRYVNARESDIRAKLAKRISGAR